MSTPTSLKIYLIRHGETKWSKAGRNNGNTDIPLTNQGELDAQQVGQRLQTIKFCRILCSPLQRAMRARELALSGAVAEIEPDLAEWNYGDYEGQLTQAVRNIRCNWDLYRDGCPGGESIAQVAARADRLISRLRPITGNVALFSHSQFGSILSMRWIGLPVSEAAHFPQEAGSVTILMYADHQPDVPVVSRWSGEGPSFSLGIYPGSDVPKETKSAAIARWENEGGEITSQTHVRVGRVHEVMTI